MKLLIVSSRFPYPLEKGDKLRLFHQLRFLSTEHSIYLVSICGTKPPTEYIEKVSQYCEQIHIYELPTWKRYLNVLDSIFSSLPGQVIYFFDNGIKRKIRRILLNEDIDHIFCQLVRTSEYVKIFPLPKTIDFMDAMSSGMHRMSGKSSWPLSLIYRLEAKRLRKYEKGIWKYFDHHTIISKRDGDEIAPADDLKCTIIPNGVDTDYFRPNKNIPKIYDLVFVGNLGYGPNIDASIRLVNWTKDLEFQGRPISVLIAGARPVNKILNLANDRVDVSGWVEDIRQSYASGKIFAAPLLTGAGLQNKILEAMAMGVPCLSTSLVNASIGGKPGKELIIADTKEEFQQAVKKSLGNPGYLKDIAENARSLVENHFSWNEFNNQLNHLLTEPLPHHGYSSYNSH